MLTPRTAHNCSPFQHTPQQMLRVWLIILRRREYSYDSLWCINAGQPGDLIEITIQAGNDRNAQQSATEGDQRIMEIEVAGGAPYQLYHLVIQALDLGREP